MQAYVVTMLSLGSALRYLFLVGCNLSRFDVESPACVEEVDLSHNNLEETPAQLTCLRILL